MGRYLTGINGAFSGKVGSVIGSNWRDVDYMRGLPKRTKKGSSELQLAQQMRFALCANQLRVIKDVLNIGFSDKKLNKITGYNAAVRLFLSEAIIGEYPNYSVDFSKITMAKGSLLPLDNVSIVLEEDISLNWVPEFSLSSFEDDRLLIVVYNENIKSYRLFDQARRDHGTISFPFGKNPSDILHIWMFCIRRDGSVVSNSLYVGSASLTEQE